MIRKLKTVRDLIDKGRIRLGMTRAELRSILGAPDQEGGSSRKYKQPSAYRYGDIQFIFPSARSAAESNSQGLEYVYVDDDVDGVDEPLFLLR